MKIYFCGSIMGGRADGELYARMIATLRAHGTVLNEIVGDPNVLEIEKTLTPKFIHDQDVTWMDEADVLVAEVTQPSLGVGYEIGRAVAMGKIILCLFRHDSGKNLSSMIAGAENGSSFQVRHYTENEYPGILSEYFERLKHGDASA